MRHKCYAVARGREPGVYSTIEEATEQTQGFSQSCMRKFADSEQAETWLILHSAYQNSLDLLEMKHGKVLVAKEKVKVKTK
ncbi:hypothetical protein BGX38DRAFT_1242808 [Terfezia claveryi]|nr:hypothetical protein BGX38DRAFT_1242808 [Terfezia claveryi]